MPTIFEKKIKFQSKNKTDKKDIDAFDTNQIYVTQRDGRGTYLEISAALARYTKTLFKTTYGTFDEDPSIEVANAPRDIAPKTSF